MEVVIEITRKCNLACQHCLRGDAQNKSMSHRTMMDVAKAFSGETISTLSMSGGEPTFEIKKMRQMLREFSCNQVEIENFWMATNGFANDSPELVTFIAEAYAQCTFRDNFGIKISNSEHHEYERGVPTEGLLSAFSFISPTENPNDGRQSVWIAEGRLKDDGDSRPPNHAAMDGIYVNVNGDVVLSCNMSYESQEKYKRGHISELDVSELCKEIQESHRCNLDYF